MDKQILSQAPQVINIVKDNREFALSVASIIVTFLAVLVALFQEKIKNLFGRSKINFEIRPESPDCHVIEISDGNGERSCDGYYIRIRVSHQDDYFGVPSAKNVEVILNRVWDVFEDGTKEIRDTFLPLPLIWSHFSPRKTNIDIPRDSFRHCDLGYIMIPPVKNVDLNPMLFLDTMVKPNIVENEDYPWILPYGAYEFEFIVVGDNIKSRTERWLIDFGDSWDGSTFKKEKVVIKNTFTEKNTKKIRQAVLD